MRLLRCHENPTILVGVAVRVGVLMTTGRKITLSFGWLLTAAREDAQNHDVTVNGGAADAE